MADDCCNPTPHKSYPRGNYKKCYSRRSDRAAPLVYHIPINQDSVSSEDEGVERSYETIVVGFEWPSEAATRTFAIPDSTKYTVGQCVYVLPDHGWLYIVSIPSDTTIEVGDLSSRHNPVAGTGVPGPFQVTIGTCPKPDVQISEIQDAISALVDVAIEEALAAEDQSPTFPSDTISELESGRIAAWNYDDCSETPTRRLGELILGKSAAGSLATVRKLGCDSSAFRIDEATPGPLGRGEVVILDRVEACSEDAPGHFFMQPEPITDSCEEGFTFLGYKEEEISCPGGSILRKLWRRLTKFVIHSEMLVEVDATSDTFGLAALVQTGNCRKLSEIELAENQVIVGTDIGSGVIRNRARSIDDLIPDLQQAFLATPVQLATTGSGTANLVANGSAFLPDWAEEQYVILRLRVKVPNDLSGGIEINGQLACSAFDISNDGPTIGTNVHYAKLSGGTFTYGFLGSTLNTAQTLAGHSFNDSEIVLLGYTSAETLP